MTTWLKLFSAETSSESLNFQDNDLKPDSDEAT